MKKQAHICYSGRVQGVGFRFTVERIANQLEVVGWVKNLPNGDVEVVAEAEEKTLAEFFDQIRSRFKRYIVNEQVTMSEAAGSCIDFQIRF